MRTRRLAALLLCVAAAVAAPPGAEVCASSQPGGESASLRCPSPGEFVSNISFASFGTPTGACPFARGGCHSNTSLAIVHAACYGQPSCTVPFHSFADLDPCRGTNKRLAIQAECGRVVTRIVMDRGKPLPGEPLLPVPPPRVHSLCLPTTGADARRAAAAAGSALCGPPVSPPVPVVFIHKQGILSATEQYFTQTIKAALEMNEHVVVLLIGLDATLGVDPRVEVVRAELSPADALGSSAAAFGEVYRHMSGNGHNYELINFQRHFVLQKLMAARKWGRVMYLDSDVMVFRNATQEAACHPCDLSMCVSPGSSSSHTSFWTKAGLDAFVVFLHAFYTVPSKLSFLQGQWENYQKHHTNPVTNKTSGGVCDMTLLAWFRNEAIASKAVPRLRVCDLCHMSTQVEDHGVFDHIVAFTLPAFRFKDGVSPLPFFEFGGKRIPLKSLHFQGGSKHLLRNCKD